MDVHNVDELAACIVIWVHSWQYQLGVSVEISHPSPSICLDNTGHLMLCTIGRARTNFAFTLMGAYYNIRQTVWLVKSGAIPW
jgi:hypothetical protein